MKIFSRLLAALLLCSQFAVASEVTTWSTTSDNNNSTPPNGWPESMQYSQVNNTGREMMGAIARWRDALSSTYAHGDMNAGSSDPGTVGAWRWWADTGNSLLKQRNAANTGWNTIATLGAQLAERTYSQNASNLSSGTVATARLPAGTTGATGIVQLSTATNSTSTTLAATPSAVKSSYDLATSAYNGDASLSTTGYARLPGGAYLEWGSGVTSAFSVVTITLPKALSTCASASATLVSILGAAPANVLNASCDATSITVHSSNMSGAGVGSISFYWQVIGY